MGRVVALDYGTKRTGIAVTDEMQIIASPLETVATFQLIDFLTTYVDSNHVEEFVIGMPRDLMNRDTDSTSSVRSFIKKLQTKFPSYAIHQIDERFTSKIAMRTMIDGGMKKSDRRKKENIDKISAAVILQSYLESKA